VALTSSFIKLGRSRSSPLHMKGCSLSWGSPCMLPGWKLCGGGGFFLLPEGCLHHQRMLSRHPAIVIAATPRTACRMNCFPRHPCRPPKALDRRLCTGRSQEAVVIFLFGLEALLTRDSKVLHVLSPPPPNYRLLLVITVIKPSFYWLPQ
jgi:hypothetical protein